MADIVQVKGKVRYKITLDPSVWIFDDRIIDLDTYFTEPKRTEQEVDEEKKLAESWGRELKEGAAPPQPKKQKTKFPKEKLLSGSFGIPLAPFLDHAEPEEGSRTLIVETKNGQHSFPLKEGREFILAFAKNGKPLREDGPVHILFPDGSNKENPIKHVTGFLVE